MHLPRRSRHTMGARLTVLLSVCGLTLSVAAADADASLVTTTITTAGETPYSVPAGASSLQVTVVGAPGQARYAEASPGQGADVQATLSAPFPGSTLYAEVGATGGAGAGTSTWAGAGGGASDVQTCSILESCIDTGDPATDPRLIVAGGGGGTGAEGFGFGGTGGSGGVTAAITGPGAGGNGTDGATGGAGGNAGLAATTTPTTAAAPGDGSGTCGGQGSAASVADGGAGQTADGGRDSDGGGGGGGWVGGSGGGAGGCGGDGDGGGGGAGVSYVASSATLTGIGVAGETGPEVSITATIAAAPAATITSPARDAVYARGQVVDAAFSCAEGTAGSGLEPGADGCSGTTADGAALDTSAPGVHAFTVTATSTDGLTTSREVVYFVRWRRRPRRWATPRYRWHGLGPAGLRHTRPAVDREPSALDRALPR